MIVTKRLYDNGHIKEFDSVVTQCKKDGDGFLVALESTAFFPNGGGQLADEGTIDGVAVKDVNEIDGVIYHSVDREFEIGASVHGEIDWSVRFPRMQNHTGEHIVCGVAHKLFGYENTGFHMGSDVITIDFDGVVPAEDLPLIEKAANEALWQNLPVECWYPTPEDLPNTYYRTKRALPWPVRIVKVPGYDSCACCGVHCGYTGEVGLVKIFSVIGFRGGSRIEMACGGRAFAMLNSAYEQNKQVSQAFSAQLHETGAAARRMNDVLAQQKYRIVGLERQIFASTAASYSGKGDVVHFEENLDSTAVRELADAIAETCGGGAFVFSGSDETGYGFCLVTRTGDLRELGKAMTKALNGRGGGKPICQQGRVQAARSEIETFFAQR